MGIRTTDKSWYFEEDTQAKPRLVCDENEADWKRTMEEEMTQPITDYNAPQFKCTYLPNVKYEGIPSGL